jgi:hypothetical protein
MIQMLIKRELSVTGLLAIVAAAVMSHASFALDRCQPGLTFADDEDKYTLGSVIMGGDLSQNPAAVVAASKCANSSDCTFTEAGVIYDITNYGEGLKVEGAEVTAESGYRHDLIADIAFGDSVKKVRQKFKDLLPKDFPKWTLTQLGGEGPTLTSDDTICGSNGEIWFYKLVFDQDARLISVSTEFDFGM